MLVVVGSATVVYGGGRPGQTATPLHLLAIQAADLGRGYTRTSECIRNGYVSPKTIPTAPPGITVFGDAAYGRDVTLNQLVEHGWVQEYVGHFQHGPDQDVVNVIDLHTNPGGAHWMYRVSLRNVFSTLKPVPTPTPYPTSGTFAVVTTCPLSGLQPFPFARVGDESMAGMDGLNRAVVFRRGRYVVDLFVPLTDLSAKGRQSALAQLLRLARLVDQRILHRG